MILDRERAADFTDQCYRRLTERFKIDNPLPVNIDIKNSSERPGDLMSRIPKVAKRYVENIAYACDAFGASIPSVKDIEMKMVMEQSVMLSAAFYDPESHTIHATVYPDVDSLVRLNKDFGICQTTPPRDFFEKYTRRLPTTLAEEVGHACRAVARQYAGTPKYSDTFVMIRNRNKIGFVEFEKLKDRNCGAAIRNSGAELAGIFELSEFFDPIGAFEGAEAMKSTSYQFEPMMSYEEELEFQNDVARMKDGIIKGGQANQSVAIRTTSTFDHKSAVVSLEWYAKMPQEFREKFIYNKELPLIHWPPERLVQTFFRDKLSDFL